MARHQDQPPLNQSKRSHLTFTYHAEAVRHATAVDNPLALLDEQENEGEGEDAQLDSFSSFQHQL